MGVTLWHNRTQTTMQVDVILENRRGEICGIQVKASTTRDGKEFKGLHHLQKTKPAVLRCAIAFYAAREPVPFGNSLWAVPMSFCAA